MKGKQEDETHRSVCCCQKAISWRIARWEVEVVIGEAALEQGAWVEMAAAAKLAGQTGRQ